MNRRFKLVLLIPTNQPTRFFALRRRKSLISIIKDYRIDKIRWKIQKKKEVIHAHLPVRIPCYDLRLITNRTVVTLFVKLELAASGSICSRPLTGGVNKLGERIHRSIADLRLLVIPTSCRRVAAYNPNWDWVCQIRSPSRVCCRLSQPLYCVCSPGCKGHADLTSSSPSSELLRQSL